MISKKILDMEYDYQALYWGAMDWVGQWEVASGLTCGPENGQLER